MIAPREQRDEQAPDANALPAIGDVLDGKYVIQAVIGEGGFARVYRAKHTRIRSMTCAVKVLLPEQARREEVVARFIREAESAAALRNRHVVRTIDFGETEAGLPYLVMDFVHGEPLDETIRREARLRPGDAARITRGVLRALDEAHALGIIHRDLKPGNIMLAVEPGERHPVAKVADFGIAKILQDSPAMSESSSLTVEGMVLCTPQYAAPEALRALPEARSDLYALGHVMIEMLEGTTAYTGATPVDVAANHLIKTPVPLAEVSENSGLAHVIRKACAKPLGERYQTPSAMLDDLEIAIEEMGIADEDPLRLGSGHDIRRTTKVPVGGPASSARTRPGPRSLIDAPESLLPSDNSAPIPSEAPIASEAQSAPTPATVGPPSDTESAVDPDESSAASRLLGVPDVPAPARAEVRAAPDLRVVGALAVIAIGVVIAVVVAGGGGDESGGAPPSTADGEMGLGFEALVTIDEAHERVHAAVLATSRMADIEADIDDVVMWIADDEIGELPLEGELLPEHRPLTLRFEFDDDEDPIEIEIEEHGPVEIELELEEDDDDDDDRSRRRRRNSDGLQLNLPFGRGR